MRSDKERNLWSQINQNFMTEESEDLESVIQHPLDWREESKHEECVLSVGICLVVDFTV